MQPVLIDDCFGWFHSGPNTTKDVAILFCQAAGQDYSNGYRPLRVLADALARDGYPVLRFDYPSTGDSGDEIGEDLWCAWRQSVTRGADWLRRVSGANRLLIAGLRIGASLAALEAAEREDVAGLIMFEPILHLRSFVLQLATESRLRSHPPRSNPQPESAGGVTLGELGFSARDVAQMRETDIARLAFKAKMPAVVFSRSDSAKLAARLSAWSEQGVTPTFAGFEAFEALVRPSQHSGEPEIEATMLLDWLRREIPHGLARNCVVPLASDLKSRDWEERFVGFGNHGRLAGVFCQPRLTGNAALLICNSGGNPRHGFARFGVALARQLAKAGIASLRFDFPGLGDSIHLENGLDTQSDVFMQDRTTEFSAAIDSLEAMGFQNIAVHGLCSGAFHAVRAAFADRRIAALSVINLPWFTLRHEPPGPDSTARKTLAAFRQRSMAVQLMFSAEDAGLRQFERHFGVGGCHLADEPRLKFSVSNAFDHELTERWMQEMAMPEITKFLLQCAFLSPDDPMWDGMPGTSSKEK